MEMTKDILVRNEIINCAQGLFKQFGLKKTTMDEIAAACGKAKSTLYHYFKSKEEVFDEVLIKEMNSLRQLVDVEVESQQSFKDKLATYFETFHREAVNKFNLLRILKQEIKQEIVNSNRFTDIIEFETKYVSNMVGRGIDNGEITGIEKTDAKLFSEVLVVAFLGIVKYSIEKEGDFDIDSFQKVTGMLIPKIFT
jgi:AcrR family transcriptional regulator